MQRHILYPIFYSFGRLTICITCAGNQQCPKPDAANPGQVDPPVMWFLRLTINKKIEKYVLAVIVLARIICRWTKSVKLFLALIFVCNQLKSEDVFRDCNPLIFSYFQQFCNRGNRFQIRLIRDFCAFSEISLIFLDFRENF